MVEKETDGPDFEGVGDRFRGLELFGLALRPNGVSVARFFKDESLKLRSIRLTDTSARGDKENEGPASPGASKDSSSRI